MLNILGLIFMVPFLMLVLVPLFLLIKFIKRIITVKKNLDNSENILKKCRFEVMGIIFIILLGFLFLYFLYIGGAFDDRMLSKYNNKVYIVKSLDGKVSGTIGTKVEACSESEHCVLAYYNLIVDDKLLSNGGDYIPGYGSYFDSNYYYLASVYNNHIPANSSYTQIEPMKCYKNNILDDPFNTHHSPCGGSGEGNLPSDKFVVTFFEMFHRNIDSPDDFINNNLLEIYDVSGAVSEHSKVSDHFVLYEYDSKKGFDIKRKIKTYEFTVTPQ